MCCGIFHILYRFLFEFIVFNIQNAPSLTIKLSTVHYRDTNDEETNNDDSLTASDMGPIVPQEELLHKVLDDRFVIGEIIAVGRVATIRQGVMKLNGLNDCLQKYIQYNSFLDRC